MAPRHGRGVTLVESLVVIALAAVLALYAIPSLRATMASNRADTLANQLVASLALARSEAVKLGQSVTVAALGTGSPAGGPYDWGSAGWCVYSGATCAAGTSAMVQAGAPVAPPMSLFGNMSSVVFDATGRVTNLASGQLEVDFIVCADGSAAAPNYPQAQGVTVTSSGRSRVAGHASGQPQLNTGTAMASCAGP